MPSTELVKRWSGFRGTIVNVVASLVRSELEADEEASHASLWVLHWCTDAARDSHTWIRDSHLEFPLVDGTDRVSVKDHDTCSLGVLISVVEFAAIGD